ncbi:MFS transporter [Sphingomonas sp. PAMC 26605]|uniref:MFS transporter n=1 Tax=Sphingomonas sp. PAMC 26605 TaxID=1112214 RepID=UPI00026CA77C|nr:MFS transporter [Sphingomonas sp. PAMC 26605]
MNERPRQSLAGLWNISFGFFGIQIGFALQNANMSRVFQTLGSSIEQLPALWIAAPLTGLLVQPIIGHLSDTTWLGRLGRRRPYFLSGAVLAALALLAMPLAQPLLFAAVMLWVLDASLNISMEPFRAFVGDMLCKDQHSVGYAVQTAFIGAGAVVGSIFPNILEYFGVSNAAPAGALPATVTVSFWFGGIALFGSVLWTVVTTREYSPAEMAAFDGPPSNDDGATIRLLAARGYGACAAWIAAGLVVAASVSRFGLHKEMYLLAGLLAAYGVASSIAIGLAKRGRKASMLGHIVGDFAGMPPLMKKLALVQFFTWSALFIMWTNTGPVVAQYVFDAPRGDSPRFQEAGQWVDVLFGTYNAVAAVAALTLLPFLAKRIGAARTHVVGLLCGTAGYASFLVLRDAHALLLSEIGIGIAWASILAMPYAILASHLPQRKLGIYMGLFNVFVVVPQLLVATVMGSIMQAFFPGDPIWTMAFAAVVMALAAVAMLRVVEPA